MPEVILVRLQGQGLCCPIQGERQRIFGFKKSLSSPQASAQTEDCIDPSCAPTEAVRLNASALFDPNSLHILLTSPFVSDSFSKISALVDSRSTHCFMDTGFVRSHQLSVYPVKPIELRLFDGTSNSVITESLQLPVLFLTGESMTIDFYVTLLDSSCSMVLGFNWLTH